VIAVRNAHVLSTIPAIKIIVGWLFGALIESGAPKIKIVNAIPVAKKTTPHVKISMIIQPMTDSLHHK
jgi:hypothetical protein